MALKDQLASYQARMQEISDEIEGVGAAAEIENRDMTDEDSAMIAALSEEFDRVAKSAYAICRKWGEGALAKVVKDEAQRIEMRQHDPKRQHGQQYAHKCHAWAVTM